MKEYCGNCKHKESCKGARTDINDDFNWCWCYQKEQKQFNKQFKNYTKAVLKKMRRYYGRINKT